MGQIQVILSEDVHALGDAGEVVSVKPGYARNYLIPQGKALIATAERVNEVEHKKRVIAEKRAKELKDLEAVKAKLDATALEISAQAGEEGKLFGSVTAAQLADLLG
jgi:large subunit ribosomal protein L9